MNEIKKTRVIILQTSIPQYREAVFNKLAERYDLTVAFTDSGKDQSKNAAFKKARIIEKRVGPFLFQKGLSQLCKDFDVVIYMPNIHNINFCLIPFLSHNYKTISYSIGFRASYDTKFDTSRKKNILDYIFKFVMFKADAVLVYMRENLRFWNLSAKTLKKCFEACNTVEVNTDLLPKQNKNTFLFVGSLYKGKGLDKLIDAYYQALNEIGDDDFFELNIIGQGSEYNYLSKRVDELNLKSKIHLCGAIYDESILASYFSKALMCISPTQAGLSVPKSMGYGVPFVTIRGAITGGEVFHIKDKENGLILENISQLKEVLIQAYNEPEKYVLMGRNAQSYYEQNATIDIMSLNISEAIEYVMNK